MRDKLLSSLLLLHLDSQVVFNFTPVHTVGGQRTQIIATQAVVAVPVAPGGLLGGQVAANTANVLQAALVVAARNAI